MITLEECTSQQRAALEQIKQWFADGDRQLFRKFGFAGVGKAERHGSLIYGPSGPVAIEDIVVGDLVFTPYGRVTTVAGVYPQGRRTSYRVTFSDGAYVDCDREHLWSVWTHKMRQIDGPLKTLNTGELREIGLRMPSGACRFSIPLCEPVPYPEQEVPIDPYVFGVLIGEGTNFSVTPTIVSPGFDHFIMEEVRRRLPSWVVITVGDNGCLQHRLTDPGRRGNRMRDWLVELGFGGVKSPQRFIPEIYKHGSIAQRWDLLRGLMDTDGCSSLNRITFSTMSSRLADDLVELIQSLGGTARTRECDSRHGFQVRVKMTDCPFLLPRKAENWRPARFSPPARMITAIEEIGEYEHTCISVADGSLYLTNGYVVTHNTSSAQLATRMLGVEGATCYAAPTGKAAHVLRTKGCAGAQTIHSLIYAPAEKSRARLRELTAALDQVEDAREREELAAEQKRLGQLSFVLKDESELSGARLLVLDEASMVNARIGRDLESFGVPILVLGDPMQLPPVDGAGYFTECAPDVLLDEVQRSAADSPVTRIATAIRRASPGDERFGVYGSDGHSGRFTVARESDLLNYDQVIVGTNRTRWRIIHSIRAAKGFEGPRPQAGDRIIILANNSDLGVYNGQQWTVESYADDPENKGRCILNLIGDKPSKDEPPEQRVLTVWKRGFVQAGDQETRDITHAGRQGLCATATFAQAITTHKAQGSQWRSVLVVDESRVFRHMAQRWLYTAATRASDQVVIVGGVRR